MTHHALKLLGICLFVLSALGSASTQPDPARSAATVNLPAYSAVELRQMQSRQFATTDVEKVSRVVDNAFKDMGFEGGMAGLGETGVFVKLKEYKIPMPAGNCCIPAGIPVGVALQISVHTSIRLVKEKKVTLVRIVINQSELGIGGKGNLPQNPAEYQKMYSAISKSLFLDAQDLDVGLMQ